MPEPSTFSDPGATILIASAETAAGLTAMVAAPPGEARPAGIVLVGGGRMKDSIGELPVLGGLDELGRICPALRVGLAIVCLASDGPELGSGARAVLREHGVRVAQVPALTDAIAEARAVDEPAPTLRRAGVDFCALIDREPHELDRAQVERTLAGRCVVVTGAGGSIGSELARLAAGFAPSKLVLMERSENALFEIDRQIARLHPGLARRAVLHDVVDEAATLRRFAELSPDVVFHAAAHKHVPLMEEHPADAVTNNVFGTASVARASVEAGVERFVLISSDKAVNPTSVMGATKRLAELFVRGLERDCIDRGLATRFATVRFGNVLGSAGSVLPIWSAQMAEGGPLTVTDPRMTRYFMTIREAATLVIQAGAFPVGQGGLTPVFVLDMGEPVRIVDLAMRFVRAHGFEPRVLDGGATGAVDALLRALRDAEANDRPARPKIDIAFTGARPGEKLHEELAYAAEQLRPTAHPGINAWAGEEAEAPDAEAMLDELRRIRPTDPHASVVEAIRRHVPEMRRPGAWVGSGVPSGAGGEGRAA
ncbi:MAG: polysaccharide biosynthesis protein [Phycisphaerales bacterium]|nr:polysaccharide biosynthesis protein [Phycisphaerales bacterium]